MSVTVRTQILPQAYALRTVSCTYMLYGLDRAITHHHHFPYTSTVKKTPYIRANNPSQYGTYNGSLGTVSIEAVCCSLSHIMGCRVRWVGIVTNAHTATDSPADACQYPVILWYDTVDKNMQLQMNWYCVSC
jgi:hypothetical protein